MPLLGDDTNVVLHVIDHVQHLLHAVELEDHGSQSVV